MGGALIAAISILCGRTKLQTQENSVVLNTLAESELYTYNKFELYRTATLYAQSGPF